MRKGNNGRKKVTMHGVIVYVMYAPLYYFSMKEKLSSLQSRLKETDNTIQAMRNEINNTKLAYQKELDEKNQLIKVNQEKVCCNL